MATVTEAVKESLVGTVVEPELSSEIRATFNRNARRDEATGEDYMAENEFIDAVAPANENYVSSVLMLDLKVETLSGPGVFSIKSVENNMESFSKLQTDEKLGE